MQRSTCRYYGHCPLWLVLKLHIKTGKPSLPHAKGTFDRIPCFYLGLVVSEAKRRKKSTFYNKCGYTVALGYIDAFCLENVKVDRKVFTDWVSMDNLGNYAKALTWKQISVKRTEVLFLTSKSCVLFKS